MRLLLNTIFFLVFITGFSQETPNFTALDSLYREDQFYIKFVYNNLSQFPSGLQQDKFSPGFSLGFLRDMPINKTRTVAIAVGLGYSYSEYNQNLLIKNLPSGNSYQVLNSTDAYSKNRISLHQIDIPIEFRWRTSTPESHKFWRVYSGFIVSYMFHNQYQIASATANYSISNNKDFNKISYGPYFTVGWNTWNAYLYYGLNSIFQSNVKIDNQTTNMNTVNMGLIFYIL
jgi:hypothetical protein